MAVIISPPMVTRSSQASHSGRPSAQRTEAHIGGIVEAQMRHAVDGDQQQRVMAAARSACARGWSAWIFRRGDGADTRGAYVRAPVITGRHPVGGVVRLC
ncbi:MAG: hypothetical protein IPM80_20560 [Proteobacteria bacterium]|nr:hypothetical protein [Pseudomonadota bacterium]